MVPFPLESLPNSHAAVPKAPVVAVEVASEHDAPSGASSLTPVGEAILHPTGLLLAPEMGHHLSTMTLLLTDETRLGPLPLWLSFLPIPS